MSHFSFPRGPFQSTDSWLHTNWYGTQTSRSRDNHADAQKRRIALDLTMTTPNQPAGRRPSKLAAALQNAVTWVHRVLYRSSNGVIGGRMADSPVLLLTTTGRRSGKQRTVPLLYLMDGPNVVLVASNGGAVRHPTWWLNLQTTSEAWIQIKGIRRRVNAKQASAAEKQHLWPRLTAMYPGYKRYQEITDRDIPVVILRSIEEDESRSND